MLPSTHGCDAVRKQIIVHQSEVEEVDGSCTEEETEPAEDESNSDLENESADEALEELKKRPTRLMNALVNEVSELFSNQISLQVSYWALSVLC